MVGMAAKYRLNAIGRAGLEWIWSAAINLESAAARVVTAKSSRVIASHRCGSTPREE
jgi:hypothetical protein